MFIVTLLLLYHTDFLHLHYITLHLHSIYITYIITLHSPTKITKKRKGMFHIHIPIWQHGSCIHLAMATKPPPILINSLHPNNAIQLTLYINQCIQL